MTSVAPPGTNGTMMRTWRSGHPPAAAERANAPWLSAEAAASPAKARRVSIGSSSPTLASRAERRCARFIYASRLVQQRLLPRATRHNGPVLRKVACRGCRERFSLFALALSDRRKIGIAIDGLLAHVLPAIEQEYGKRDGNQCTEYGAKRPVPCLVVVHRPLRSFGLMENACVGS